MPDRRMIKICNSLSREIQCKQCSTTIGQDKNYVKVQFKTHHLELCMDCAQSLSAEISEKLKQYNWNQALRESGAELI